MLWMDEGGREEEEGGDRRGLFQLSGLDCGAGFWHVHCIDGTRDHLRFSLRGPFCLFIVTFTVLILLRVFAGRSVDHGLTKST
ncbi:uncharacterized protein CC84DRAFT_517178 [Paraphaeosphaeria sporulosa]|uniref:Transmembrane protein n=1 Tax=Paraphaeosphaeria sporulosa TaxID=1460663 RepID=A0A177CV06_9PLEO|nr:uncharacterized protein CC84DRAFT_517178 [Paraphaeosphaeria sporulosa]OAG11041.1 hypothetical protein CC84DRAFT_517178 [Paraphaeosphaeria sporulosa]